MRVLTLFLTIVVIVAVGAVAVAFFDVMTVPVLSEVAYGVKGYGLAKTPDEALERYKKALEARNYNMATRFIDGDFAVQLRKQAKVTTRLAKAVDNFRSTAKDRSLVNDKVEFMLAALEVFPQTISVREVKASQSGDTATAIIATEGSSRLIPKAGVLVNLKKTDEVWRLVLPLDPATREMFDSLEKNGQDYVNALDSVKTRMKTDATTKENVFSDLQEEFVKIDPKWRR